MRRMSGVGALANAEKLEQVQLLAARIVSGLPIFAIVKLLSITKQVGFHYSAGAR